MSIILDALKKSESDQQRQSGPALFEVRVAPPKARFPVWAIAVVVLLVVNLSIVGYLLLRHPSRGADTTAATPASVAPGADGAGRADYPPANGGGYPPSGGYPQPNAGSY